jgi:hypothetical protein
MVLLLAISVAFLSSCSSSKKLKKKCLDCPEFSLLEEKKAETFILNENI